MSNPVIVVVGAGPGMGASVARRFARDGFDVALVGQAGEALDALGRELQGEGITTGWTGADLTDQKSLHDAVTRFAGHADRIDVLHYNPSNYRPKNPLDLTVGELLEDVAIGVGGLLTAVQAARPFMSAGGRVTATGS